MSNKLSIQKRQEYDQLCDTIAALTQELSLLGENNKEAAIVVNRQLEKALNKCTEFVRREFYNI